MGKEFNLTEQGTNSELSVEKNIEKKGSMMKADLQELQNWQSNSSLSGISPERKAAFVAFFSQKLNEVFKLYASHKKDAWSFKKNIPYMVGTAILPVIGAAAGYFLPAEGVVTSGITIGMIGSVWIVIKMYTDWVQSKNAKETWVRHSACFHRLYLELTRFLLSERTDNDFQLLMDRTFQILDQDLDQLVMNLSPQGIAERKTNEE